MEGIVPQGAGVVSAVASVADCTGNVTVVIAAGMEGPEKGAIPLKFAAAPRVSTRRQGVIAMNVRALLDTWFDENWSCGPPFPSEGPLDVSRRFSLGLVGLPVQRSRPVFQWNHILLSCDLRSQRHGRENQKRGGTDQVKLHSNLLVREQLFVRDL